MSGISGQELLDKIRPLQAEIDAWIAGRAEDFITEHLARPEFRWHFGRASHELFNLSKGKDAYYDRPGYGPAYALWYQGRRINQALAALANPISEFRGKQIDVFDLGAGTGSVMTAIVLLRWAMLELSGDAPVVRIVNIDSSPFMLDYARFFFRGNNAEGRFKEAVAGVSSEFNVCAWQNSGAIVDGNACWISASYLFDHLERTDTLKESFWAMIQRWKPDLLWFSTSAGKLGHIDEFAAGISEKWSDIFREAKPLLEPFNGPMNKVNEVRGRLAEKKLLETGGGAAWKPDIPRSKLFEARSPELRLRQGRWRPGGVSIYDTPLNVRKGVELTEDQEKAARFVDAPRIIFGPAGCGKSLVITEAVKNVIDRDRNRSEIENVRILVTTFNKALVSALKNWLSELLGVPEIERRPDNPHYILKVGNAHIQLMHFDILPTRLGKIKGNIELSDQWHEDVIHSFLDEVLKMSPPGTKSPYAEPAYILDEFHRVVYAQQIGGAEEYKSAVRLGRGLPGLKKGGPTRAFLWEAIKRYRLELGARKKGSILTQRWLFLNALQQKDHEIDLFDYVFVDEFQDCTDADFEIFYRLLKDSNRLMVAGDVAQAVHIGTSARTPRDHGSGREQAKFRKHLLKGSYRLPYWICQALRPFSEGIVQNHSKTKKDATEAPVGLSAWKGAPPGSRPIVIHGEGTHELATRIFAITRAYEHYEPGVVTILEQDTELVKALNEDDPKTAFTDTVLRLKGLEKRVVVWSTSPSPPSLYDVDEVVYTILTRSSCLLIIAISPRTRSEYTTILKQLDPNYLIFGDEQSEEAFRLLIKD